MNRIIFALLVICCSSLAQAAGHGTGNFVLCDNQQNIYQKKLAGTWVRDAQSIVTDQNNYTTLSFEFNEARFNDFSQIIVTDNFCVYVAGTVHIKSELEGRSYPFVVTNVDGTPALVMITETKWGIPILKLKVMQISNGVEVKDDTLHLGGEEVSAPMATFRREN